MIKSHTEKIYINLFTYDEETDSAFFFFQYLSMGDWGGGDEGKKEDGNIPNKNKNYNYLKMILLPRILKGDQ
jgi:hypothetical protein